MARAKKPSTTGDLIRSLLVILVPLLVLTVIFTRLPDDHPVTVVDWRPVLGTARAEAPYPVVAPTGLGADWRPTRVSWVKQGNSTLTGDASPRNEWRLGFLNPDDVYLELSQGDLQVDDFIQGKTRAGVDDGTSTVNGQTWRRVVSPDDRTRSLVLSSEDVTTIVSGDVAYDALERFAGSLSPTA